jgi:hypothetical protein
LNVHLPTGSSDEILIPSSGSPPSLRNDRARSGRAAEEVLRHALHARCGDAIPRWTDVLAVAHSLATR